jgi:hypothetical protein
VSPLVSPTAFTDRDPGRAAAGIMMVVTNEPEPSVVADPTYTGPMVSATVSAAANPCRVTSTGAVGGPDVGSRAIDGTPA